VNNVVPANNVPATVVADSAVAVTDSQHLLRIQQHLLQIQQRRLLQVLLEVLLHCRHYLVETSMKTGRTST
jgi:hypothetical protein